MGQSGDIEIMLLYLGWVTLFGWVAEQLVERDRMVLLTIFIAVMILVAWLVTRRNE